ncbi:hypothetical protein [Olivibacter sitiensis]|uniref:hypothetical protein n=1 Tax=Olivibacter sitiensis TaxID=376470 RepID=UPI0004263579|nr:hypothetical protein [Olivibacter sitiensis]
MKKNRPIFLLTLILSITTFFPACRQDDLNGEVDSLNSLKANKPLSERKKITDWINAHEEGLNLVKKANINLFKANLLYDEMRVESRKNGDDLIIIPIRDGVGEKINLGPEYLLNLLVVQSKTGKLRWSTVVCFLPENGNKRTVLKEKTIQNIINNEPVFENGLFKFLDLKGKLLYQLEYKDQKLSTYGSPRKKGDTNSPNVAKASIQCYDYYLITTYFENGTVVEQTEEYLYTECDEDSSGGDGGGGGSGGGSGNPGGDNPGDSDPEDPEEENDATVPARFVYEISHTNYDNDDLYLPEDTEIEYDGDTPLPPMGFPSPLRYVCMANITYRAVDLSIVNAFTYPMNLTPNNETYLHPNWGQVARVVTKIGESHFADFIEGGHTATFYWSCDIHFRWTYLTAGGTRTRQVPFSHSVTASVPL